MKATPTFSLADQLFNADSVGRLADWMAGAYPGFDRAGFVEDAVAPFPELALKERITHLAGTIDEHLPSDFDEALAILLDALPPKLDPTLTDDDFGDFIVAPFSAWVAARGQARQHLDDALGALRAITMRFSAEDAIRTFINLYPDEVYPVLMTWTDDDNYHVRRLASEGTRPKLPWAGKLTVDHTWPLPILDRLYTDSTRYVTRSVANHLNDIAKIDPDLVVATLARWQEEGKQDPKEMAWITKHALRTLVKKGDAGAFELLGYGDAPEISEVSLTFEEKTIAIGKAIRFTVAFVADTDQSLLVDYAITFPRPDGRSSRKVFKLKQIEVATGEQVSLSKKHPIKPMTTRAIYAGEYGVEVVVNGEIVVEGIVRVD